eukprot:m.34038 g.34038  ORF g.34038 m.34038 type:complete len:306 (-) comp12269_c0_seq1:18-935(-)
MMLQSSLLLGLLACTLLLTLCSASDTCPAGVPGCRPSENDCKICHPSCLYCQNIGEVGADGLCGANDCLQCLHGYRFIELYEDGTGQCTDKPAIYKPTCPEGASHCSPENLCDTCHPTCQHCQGETSTCGVKDCITCKPGLVHHPIFSDESGECLPPGVKLEAHELTCPEDVPGCFRDNRCTYCDASCETCQSLTTVTGRCLATDCFTCPEGHVLEPVQGNTGRCVVSSKVRKPKMADPNQHRQQPAAPVQQPAAPTQPSVQQQHTVEEGSGSGSHTYIQLIMAAAALFLANKAGVFRALLRRMS